MANSTGNGAEDVLSMVDVLEEDNALQEEANAVLGACDDENCTYSQVRIVCCRCFKTSCNLGPYYEELRYGPERRRLSSVLFFTQFSFVF